MRFQLIFASLDRAARLISFTCCWYMQAGPNIVLAIAANKQDLRKDQAVSDMQLAEYAASIGAVHFGTSAKTGEGLAEIFEAMANLVVSRQRETALSTGEAVRDD